MKLGLISDIHGDMVALELAWAHLTVFGADRIVCAGDLVGYGPHPDQVVAFLSQHGIDSVRGNHDRWAVERASGVPSVPGTFGGAKPSSETVEALKSLPAHLLVNDGPRVGVIFHGSPNDDMDFVTKQTHSLDRLDRWLTELDVNLLVVGHTHKPMLYRSPNGLVINPGSVISAPVVSTSRTFAFLEWEAMAVSFHDVESGNRVEVQDWGAGGV
jgi:putative phosphoesterase